MTYSWLPEAYAEFAISFIIIALRVFARTKVTGIKGWQGDDYLILVALALFIAMAALCPTLAAGSPIHPSPTIAPDQKAIFIKAATFNQVAWPLYVSFIWSLKLCMLFFYKRLTAGLPQYALVKIGFWATAITYVICMVELFVHCLPLKRLWDFETNQGKICTSSLVNFYVVGISNFLTDALLLSIAIPFIYGVRAPLAKKIMVTFLLGSGVFIMAATLVRNIVGLLQIDGRGMKDRLAIIVWALRELFVAIIVVNAPCIKPLFTSSFWASEKSSKLSKISGGGDTVGSRGQATSFKRGGNSPGFLYKEELTQQVRSAEHMELYNIDIESGKDGKEEIIVSSQRQVYD